jgi:hypothetical protein
MAPLEFDHDKLVEQLGLKIEKDKKFGLIKFFVPWGDQKTDLIGTFYPDVTCLRREGKTKLMIEVVTPYSFEDPDEVRRLEGLNEYCSTNNWEFYIACPDEKTKQLTAKKIEGRKVQPRAVWIFKDVPFEVSS